jgi:hypothetical protein
MPSWGGDVATYVSNAALFDGLASAQGRGPGLGPDDQVAARALSALGALGRRGRGLGKTLTPG